MDRNGYDDRGASGGIKGRERPAPYTEITEPVSGRPMLLTDPELRLIEHTPDTIVCDDQESFVAAVLLLQGDSKLVEFRGEGLFRHANGLMGRGTAVISYKLKAHETAGALCLAGEKVMGQRELLRYAAQHPGVLVPQDENPDEVWEQVAVYKSQTGVKTNIEHTDERVIVHVDREDTVGPNMARLWTAISPVYDGYEPEEVTLRMDVDDLDADKQTGQVSGKLTFHFSLWQPGAEEVRAAAADQAVDRMRADLPDMTIIRGNIAR